MSDELEADGADYYEHERLRRLHDEEERECALRAKVERLERENAVTRKDRERLDWLSSYASSHRYPWGVAWGFAAPSHSQDLREAIDATRAKDTQP